ncbi:hypothetical protein [Paraburkholderia sp. Ac-20347]|uniref:plasmid mobilization protein n=1 Tax=Paraburkholderia sp. Ac-20347 TaxID=2703892 RepID=UPI0019807F02|nr:hypothetical protein [Paraburkholderia sp. Ac-20347]MBN3808155.1 hypothetical protein [Paraburkholderia sp. Ac-20347]
MSERAERRQRTVAVGFSLTCEQHAAVVQKAGDCGLTLAAYVRACALGRKTRNVSTSRVLDALVTLGYEQRRIGELLEQDFGRLPASERAILLAEVTAAQCAVIDIIRRLDDAGPGLAKKA